MMEGIAEAKEQATATVRDVMTKKVHKIRMGTSVIETANLLAEQHLRRVVVVNEENVVMGVVSQRDVLKNFLSIEEKKSSQDSDEDDSYSTTEIGSLINQNRVITVSPEIPLLKAAVVLATNKIGCLPVVGSEKELVGLLSTTDLLRHYTGRTQKPLESSFQFYSPASEARAKMPAYIRKVNGELVIPKTCLKNHDAVMDYAVLGYDPPTGRILIKFTSDDKQDGVMKIKVDSDSLVIPARGFVTHFDLLGRATAFDVADHDETTFLVLTPRQPAAVTIDPKTEKS